MIQKASVKLILAVEFLLLKFTGRRTKYKKKKYTLIIAVSWVDKKKFGFHQTVRTNEVFGSRNNWYTDSQKIFG